MQLAHGGEELGAWRDQVHVAGHRLDDHAGNAPAVFAERIAQALCIVVVEHQRMPGQIRRHAGGRGIAESQHARPRLHQQAVAVTVVAAFELDDGIASGEAAGQPDRAHGGLGAGRYQAHHVHAGHPLHQQFGQLYFAFRRRPESKPLAGGLLHRAHGIGIGMTENQRPPGTDVVDVRLAIGIPDPGAFAVREKARCAAYGTEGADRRRRRREWSSRPEGRVLRCES